MIESDIDFVSFTGSSATGKIIAQTLSGRLIPFAAELGGSSPCLVFEDVDVNDFVEEIFWRRFYHSGQTCDSVKRLIVHEWQFDAVVDGLVDVANSRRLGPAIEFETELGPLVAQRQVERIASQVNDAVVKGAKVLKRYCSELASASKHHLAGPALAARLLGLMKPSLQKFIRFAITRCEFEQLSSGVCGRYITQSSIK